MSYYVSLRNSIQTIKRQLIIPWRDIPIRAKDYHQNVDHIHMSEDRIHEPPVNIG